MSLLSLLSDRLKAQANVEYAKYKPVIKQYVKDGVDKVLALADTKPADAVTLAKNYVVGKVARLGIPAAYLPFVIVGVNSLMDTYLAPVLAAKAGDAAKALTEAEGKLLTAIDGSHL